MTPHTTTSESPTNQRYTYLIEQIGRGDQAALEALIAETSRPVKNVIRGIVADPAAAEELASDVYLQIWKKAQQFDRTRGTPLRWMLTIARSRAVDHARWKRSPELPIDMDAAPHAGTGGNPESNSSLAESRRLIELALQKLSSEQREVVRTIFFGGLSHREASRQLRLPVGTVKTRIRLSLAKLRIHLRHMYDAGGPVIASVGATNLRARASRASATVPAG